MPKLRLVAEVLCDSGEDPIGIEIGNPIETVGEVACRKLDKAYLTNVVVFRCGKSYYIGEYTFDIHKVSEKAARETAKDFNGDDEGDDEGNPPRTITDGMRAVEDEGGQ